MGPIRELWNRKTRKHLAFALLVGLALRLFFVFYLPTLDIDTELYKELGQNLLVHHAYAYENDAGTALVPSDIRVPGYPVFLGVLYIFFGDSQRAVLIAQAFVDLGTCVLIALLAASLAPERSRQRVLIAALWLGATCPFVANYAAVELTEVLATFVTAAALLVLVWAYRRELEPALAVRKPSAGTLWFLGGVAVGLGSLVRPETPVTLAAPAVVLAAQWYKPSDWTRLLRAGVLLAAGLLVALAPWAARNWITLHKVQFLTARYVQMPGAYIPAGFYAWTRTWLVTYKDDDAVLNRLEVEPLQIEYFPPSAFDSSEERARVAALLEDQHNESFTFSPAADAQFAELARERTARHPLRTYLIVPFRRALTLWFTPRTELLPYEGQWWPLIRQWSDYDTDFAVGALYVALNLIYAGLALAGAYSMRKQRGVALLAVFVIIRTVVLAYEHFTVEPRFVLPCIPAVLALAALVWASGPRKEAPIT